MRLLLVLVLLLAAAPVAQAATVEVREVDDAGQLVYVAAPGESNDLRVSRTAVEVLELVDPSAPIVPGTGCSAVSEHHVRCLGPESVGARALYFARVDLGDGDDRFATGEAVHQWTVAVDAGAGNDVVGGTAWGDELAGGDGDDQLLGLGGNDQLRPGAGNDLADGGTATDLVLFSERSEAVTIDLAGERGETAGEQDRLVALEDARGGAGDDTLTGTRGANGLQGGDGDDALRGGEGQDTLEGGAGDDELLGEGASDGLYAGAGTDRVVCGPGLEDQVNDVAGDDFVDRDCDALHSALSARRVEDHSGYAAGPYLTTRTLLRWRLPCLGDPAEEDPSFDRVRRCNGRIRLTAAGGLVVGSGRFAEGRERAVVRLTPAGRRLLARSGGAVVRVTITGTDVALAAWKTRLGRR